MMRAHSYCWLQPLYALRGNELWNIMVSETKQRKGGKLRPFSRCKEWDICTKCNKTRAMKSTPSALFRLLDLIFRWKFTDFSGGGVIEKASRRAAAPLPTHALLFMGDFFLKELQYLKNLPQVLCFCFFVIYIFTLCKVLCSCGSFFMHFLFFKGRHSETL